MKSQFITLLLFAFLLTLSGINRDKNMQEIEFYELPKNSRIERIKFIKDEGFAAFDKNNNKLFTILTYDNGPDYVSEGLIRIIDKNKIGFADLNGEIVITPRFDAALPFSENLAAVCSGCLKIKSGEHIEIKGGKWGFADKTGELVIPYKYDKIITSYSDGIAEVQLSGNVLRINKNEFIHAEGKMNYAEWIGIFDKTVNLISNLYFDEDYFIRSSYAKNDDYLFTDEQIQYLTVTLFNKDRKLVEYDIIPWTDFSLNRNGNDFTNEFLIVTEFAVVYKSGPTTELTPEELKQLRKFDVILKEVLDFQKLNLLQKEELNYPNDVQVISSRVYNYYVELQIAIPGSRLPEKEEWRRVCKNRMLHLYLVPDIGNVKSSWVTTEPDVMNVYYLSAEDSLLNIFKQSIDRALNEPDNRHKIYEEGEKEIRKLFNAANSYVNVLNDRYANRLYRWLPDRETEVYPTTENIFGDYEPKRTPDTILDYAPYLENENDNLPPADDSNLFELVNLFKEYKSKAERNPGYWEEGNIILGAKPKEYKPSKEELILSEIGERIKTIIDNSGMQNFRNILKQFNDGKIIEYNRFHIIHMDVMGSGRFFYVEDIENIRLE